MEEETVYLIGEPILDITIPINLPKRSRSAYGRSDALIYEQTDFPLKVLGGCLYITRFIRHFANVQVILPTPVDGFHSQDLSELLKQYKNESCLPYKQDINQITWNDRKLYEIQRFHEIKIKDGKFSIPPRRALLRVDSGDSSKIDDDTIEDIIQAFRRALRRAKDTKRRIFLADYDIGLFGPKFLENIAGVLTEEDDVYVYARRKWAKFATHLSSCTIIADSEETVEELGEFEGFCKESKFRDNDKDLFKCVFSRYPHLSKFIVVDRDRTRIGTFEKNSITIYTLSFSNQQPFTPTGNRAIIAASLCYLENNSEFSISQKIAKSHIAGRFGGEVLTEHFGTKEATHLSSEDTKTEIYKLASKVHKSSYDLTAEDQDHCRNCKLNIKTFIESKPYIFIGHGRNPDWLILNNYLKGKGIRTAAYEIEVDGKEHVFEVLDKALRKCNSAILIMTTEDRLVDGTERARQNVIHEIGLFQGRLGLKNIIIIEQKGVEIFSNIDGFIRVEYDEEISDVFPRVEKKLTAMFPHSRGKLD